jgi:phosphate transport system permease protein
MSSVVKDVVGEATPMKPWVRPRASVQRDILTFVGVALLSYVVVLFTGFARIDGWLIVFFILSFGLIYSRARKMSPKDRRNALVQVGIIAAAVVAFLPWMSILASVIGKGVTALRPNFFFQDMRTTTPDDELTLGGAAHALLGTFTMVVIATVITLPLGILSGVYVTEIRGRLTRLVRFVVQSMSGVPSIVAGLFIYTTYVDATNSFSALAGSLALGVLMLPTVARTSEEVLKLVPEDIRGASYALGSRQWRTILYVVLPTVRSGLTTAAILGVARVIGETAPLLLTSLSNTSFVFNPVQGPMASMPMYVFGLLQIGTEYAIARAWAGSLVLLLIVFALFAVARKLGGKDRR